MNQSNICNTNLVDSKTLGVVSDVIKICTFKCTLWLVTMRCIILPLCRSLLLSYLNDELAVPMNSSWVLLLSLWVIIIVVMSVRPRNYRLKPLTDDEIFDILYECSDIDEESDDENIENEILNKVNFHRLNSYLLHSCFFLSTYIFVL